ncbi:hypothetical protein EDC04DRAFT_2644105 [Pisolithus marmoratus]|nr:hypothetical protein EDC04DRAFT_2644105 [Pisolithus marmoratus]
MVLLLKALSTSLPDKCLVTRVVQSPVYGSRHKDSQSDLSLFTFAQPLVWQHDGVNTEMNKQFEDIRKHFNVLVHPAKQRNNYSIAHELFGFPFMGTQDGSTPQTGDDQKQGATKFFMDMFGIEHLENYIGSITFFKHLPKLLDAGGNSGNLSQMLTAMHGPSVEKDSQAMNDPYIRILASKLLQRMPINVDNDGINWKTWRSEKRKVECDVEEVSKCLGVMLLDAISVAYQGAQNSRKVEWNIASCYDLQLMVQEIITLQNKLDTTDSASDEFKALEEDIIERILWTCLHGIYVEVEGVLAKVVHCILSDRSISTEVLGMRTELLQDMGLIFKNALSKLHSDDQPYLWQVMCHAKLGISKYQLYVTEQVKHKSTNLIEKVPSSS